MNIIGKIAGRVLLLVLSVLFGLACAEGLLRILRPDLRLVASSKLVTNSYRIYTNPRNLMDTVKEPGIDGRHTVIFNATGFHQHRDFSVQKPPGVFRIGIFGDSFAANLRMPVEYSLSEPLEYLLNRAGKNVEVLNFATDGYGTDQCYLQYLDEAAPFGLDMVLYLFCENDLKDNLADHLFELDTSGKLKYLPRQETPLSMRLVRLLYLTYFTMTVFKDQVPRLRALMRNTYDQSTTTTRDEELDRRAELQDLNVLSDSDESRKALQMFQAIMDRWRAAIRTQEQTFHVMLVPLNKEVNAKVAGDLKGAGFDVMDLYPAFEAEPDGISNKFYRTDIHWNRDGNKIATVAFFKYLAPRLSLDEPSDDFIRRGLSEYYSAFGPTNVSPSWLEPVNLAETERVKLNEKYRGLERVITEQQSLHEYGRNGGHL